MTRRADKHRGPSRLKRGKVKGESRARTAWYCHALSSVHEMRKRRSVNSQAMVASSHSEPHGYRSGMSRALLDAASAEAYERVLAPCRGAC